jgi:hypothetical protein
MEHILMKILIDTISGWPISSFDKQQHVNVSCESLDKAMKFDTEESAKLFIDRNYAELPLKDLIRICDESEYNVNKYVPEYLRKQSNVLSEVTYSRPFMV